MVVDEERKKSIWMSCPKYALISQSPAKCLSYRALILRFKPLLLVKQHCSSVKQKDARFTLDFFLFNHTSQANGMLLLEKDFYLRVIFTRVAIYELGC